MHGAYDTNIPKKLVQIVKVWTALLFRFPIANKTINKAYCRKNGIKFVFIMKQYIKRVFDE